jgi:hypothetical protein
MRTARELGEKETRFPSRVAGWWSGRIWRGAVMAGVRVRGMDAALDELAMDYNRRVVCIG